MLNNLIKVVNWVFPARIAHAHCDIPCAIYDPHEAEIAAETVEKMVSQSMSGPVVIAPVKP